VPLDPFAGPALFIDLRELGKRWSYLGGEGARLLLDHGVAGVGIDALSIGGWGGPEVGEPAHALLLGAGKVIVEDPAGRLRRRPRPRRRLGDRGMNAVESWWLISPPSLHRGHQKWERDGLSLRAGTGDP
jgi:hypothetical protein